MARPSRRASLTDAELAEWAQYARLVRPLRGRRLPDLPPAPALAPALAPASSIPPSSPAIARASAASRPSLAIGASPGGLDRATWEKFRTGKLVAARTLDLHGKTAERAFHTLVRFLHTAHADRLRCVEIITGRGGAGGTGVIRRELPMWLNLDQLRPLVLAAAHPHPANPGSTRLLLRRIR